MKDLTLVLMTCGEETEGECLKAIAPFRNEIEFFEVRNVFPQIKALNQMVDNVETEFFIPLDADIVLYPDAYSRIRTAIERYRDDPTWHTILFPLWDTLTERKILALKILRSAIIKAHPFEESATPDVKHFKALTDAGYVAISNYIRMKPIGEHRVQGKHFCYHKYKDVYLTLRSHGWEWDAGVFMGGKTIREKAKAHFDFFLLKWIETDNDDYLHCIAGMTDGLTSPVEHKSKTLAAKEYRIDVEYAIHAFYEWYLAQNVLWCPEYAFF